VQAFGVCKLNFVCLPVSCELNFDCELPAGDLRIEFCIFVGEVVNQIKLCVIFMVKSRIESNLCD
jgi:hypothetical protein